MYNVRQFKPLLYILLMVGMLGYALAAQAPGGFLGAFVLIAINAWLVKSRRFSPLPRWLANAVTLLGFIYVAAQMKAGINAPILLISQFLIFLQIVKLYEQRANRDYAQLLVLSLLLMVAAAISTSSLIFGMLMIIYLFLSLYCCLLFHLKVEADHAKASYALPENRVNEATLQQDQKKLSSSMRRLTGLVSGVAITSAIIVFLFFPRGTGAGLLAPLQFKPSQTLTGFNDQVSFQNIARISQNNAEVATVKVTRDKKPVKISPLMLRGMTLDVYNGNDSTQGAPWGWSRTRVREEDPKLIIREQVEALSDAPAEHALEQVVKLKPTGTSVLFALPGIVSFSPSRDMQIQYSARDGVLQGSGPLVQELRYTVVSTGQIPRVKTSMIDAAAQAFGFPAAAIPRSNIDPQIKEYARRADVSGGLAEKRSLADEPSPLDETIAKNIEQHLRTNFAYTLDLTDTRRIEEKDPMVAFLYDFKKGHCEYFAGAMTLMCQSLHLTARMVVGFKCDDYNNYGKFFTVRQSHAHAWVEVLTPAGWKTFDPTSGREASRSAGRQAELWDKMRHLFDYMEYTWAQSVVAYDNDDRTNLIQQMETSMTNTAINGTTLLNGIQQKWLNPSMSFWTSPQLISVVMGLMVAALLVAIGWFVRERWRLRRRAARIGIQSLPASDQLRLARQLGFYDDLLRLLEQCEIVRPRHLTPMEFSNSLSFLPSEIYDTIQRLTGIFYRIRFGGASLSATQRKRLGVVIERLQSDLPKST